MRTCKRCKKPVSGSAVFCSVYCSAKHNNEVRKREPKKCDRHDCDTMTLNTRFCSIACNAASQRKATVTARSKGKKSGYARCEPFSQQDRQLMIDAQNGRCACCGKSPRRWVVDHCHETGKVRGMLCWPCNTSIGALGDSLEGVMRAVQYLQRSAPLA